MSNIQNHDSENRENDSKDEKISELLSKLVKFYIIIHLFKDFPYTIYFLQLFAPLLQE